MKSEEIFKEAEKLMPGGVNSPVRAFRAVGMTPRFMKSAKGAVICDIDGREYIDYVCSFGPMILGHARQEVVEAVCDAAMRGTSYGAPTEAEVELAEMIREAVPCVEMMRLVNSGTEAVMSAIRAARGFTGRDMIVKFVGCYHGHSDGLLVKAGSGLLTEGVPDSAGVPASYAKETITAEYNNLENVKEIFERYRGKIAALIVEPVAANMGVVPPEKGFLEGLRQITKENGTVLIFDEVITGFRLSYGGAGEYYGVKPDLVTLGKIVGGGMPMAAYGGKREIMETIAPVGPVYQAGTLSGNPVAVAAGLATLKLLKRDREIYTRIDQAAAGLKEAFEAAGKKYGVDLRVNRTGSLLSVFFTDREVKSYEDVQTSDLMKFKKYFAKMLEKGIYVAPSQFEAMFVSDAHGSEELERTILAVDYAVRALQEGQ
jgi:glutamate-1-semialdehyde 2,1-aminomutase